MLILQWCKMQIICILILGYIGVIYIREGNYLINISSKKYCNNVYDLLYVTAEIAILFDGITAVTVNFLNEVPHFLNLLLHLGMYISYEIYLMLLFWYWVSVTIEMPKNIWLVYGLSFPCVISVLLTFAFMSKLEFWEGEYTNYSMGPSVRICFVCVVIYAIMTLGVIIVHHRYISKNKMKCIIATLICICIILTLQIVFPEYLVSAMAIALITISIYITMENPSIKTLEHYHREMVTGFATLVENKDDNTGGHIRRSSAYAVLIAKNLRKTEKYRKIITGDFIDNLAKSAPMHDIGKIGIPDVILQKPGKLTSEEFDEMKKHPVIGGKIIEETFSHLGKGEYETMAYDIAMFHHEKWNGKGYPEGKTKAEIPLSARIMAVADVFDAVSAKRCYRDALPLEECYSIISKGRGTDFDPDIVDAFMYNLNKVESIYYTQNGIVKK